MSPSAERLSEEVPLRERRGPGKVRGNNRLRILETSLALFNTRGAAAVSTNTIAGQLGISPGNLYYHFPNKEAIVRELWMQGHDVFALHFALPEDGSLLPPEAFAGMLVSVLQELVHFRFLVRDLEGLTARDPELAAIVRAQFLQGQDFLVALFNSLIDHKVMSAPTESTDLQRLGTNLLSVLLNWLRLLSTTERDAPTDSLNLAEGALHAFVIAEPRLERAYARRARAFIEGKGKKGARPATPSRSRAKR